MSRRLPWASTILTPEQPAKPPLGEVFCACVFGHYVFAHQLAPILRRSRGSSVAPGRIIWSSSVEAVFDAFSTDDIQAFRSTTPYESAKRLTDLLVLTRNLPSARPYSKSYLAIEDEPEGASEPPRMYLTHPGIVTSSLFPVPWFLLWAYHLSLLIARWVGSPWHTVDAYSGSMSAAWIAMSEQDALDELQAERTKWGSGTNRSGRNLVKRTEVEGWGWEGKVEDITLEKDGVTGVLRKTIGRKRGAPTLTEEDLEEFEEMGAECWDEMEDLRQEWAEILELDAPKPSANGKSRS